VNQVDPDLKAEFEAQSKRRGAVGSGAENPLNFDVAGFLAGSSGGSAPAAAAAAKQGGGGKRR